MSTPSGSAETKELGKRPRKEARNAGGTGYGWVPPQRSQAAGQGWKPPAKEQDLEEEME